MTQANRSYERVYDSARMLRMAGLLDTLKGVCRNEDEVELVDNLLIALAQSEASVPTDSKGK